MKDVFQNSILWRVIDWIALFCHKQWQESWVVSKFLNPPDWDPWVGRSSLFFRLWEGIRKALVALYQKLGLERLFADSLLGHPFFWCLLPPVLAPFLPTMLLLGLSLLGGLTVLLHLVRRPHQPLVYAPMNRYITFYGLAYLVASFFSITPGPSLQVGLLSCVFILFAIALQNGVQTRRQLSLLMEGMVLSATLVALYGIYQYLFQAGYQSEAWVDSNMFTDISFRVPSTMDNPNMLGQFFILSIPLTGALLLGAKTWGRRVIWTCCAGLQVICMLLTFSRGAWLGLLCAGLLFFLFLAPRILFLAPVALVALYFILPASVVERFTSIGDLSDASTSYRVYIWLGTLDMLEDYWISGVGAGDAAFNLVYPAYSYSGIVAPHSHNLFLQIVCDGGVFLLLIFCLMLFQFFRGISVGLRRGGSWETKLLCCASCSGIAGFMVQAMTDYSFYNHRVMFLFWVVIALGGLALRREKMEESG